MSANESLMWTRGSTKLTWRSTEIVTPGALLWAAELPKNNGFAIVTLFDECTPQDLSNAFIYVPSLGFSPLKIQENEKPVRFLGCYSEGEKIVFNAANETEYLLNSDTLEVQLTRYYR